MKGRIVIAALLLAGCRQAEDARAPAQETPAPAAAIDSSTTRLHGAFSTPESVLYDEIHDVYLVSNINGGLVDHDDNGFISRIKPDGSLDSLKWLDAARPDIRLNGPKGMAIHGDTLFVADIDTVRVFLMSTKTELPGRAVAGATFLNDLTIGPDGTLYVSDTGMNADFSPTGTDAVYRFEKAGPTAVVKGPWLAQPNGLSAGAEGLTIVQNGGKAVIRLASGNNRADTLAVLPASGLDGLIRQDANNLFVTSWEAKTIYHVDVPNRAAHPILTGLESPADIGFDTRRRLLLIPLFLQNKVEVRKLP